MKSKRVIVNPRITSNLMWELGIDSNDSLVSTFHGINEADDMDAIRVYFNNTQAITPEAVKIKDEFNVWFDKLWWVEKTTSANYDLARNMRNRFNLANVKTPVERAAVVNSLKTGTSSEELKGEVRRVQSDGMLPGPVTPPKDPIIPREWLVGGIVVIGLSAVVAAHGAATSLVHGRPAFGR